MNALFAGKTSIRVRAVLAGERIDTRAFETTHRLATAPLVISVGEEGCAVLFRYGAVVLFNLAPVEEAAFLKHLQPLLTSPYGEEDTETEEAEMVVDPGRKEGVSNGVISLQQASLERLQVVASILAKSVVLAHYETRVATAFERIEPLAEALQRRGAGGHQAKDLLRHIGETLLIQHKMVGRVEIGEKPELLWEHPELERLYLRLEDEYELRERDVALERKLDLISNTAQTLLDLLQNRRTLRVEWYIVILIFVEIALTLYEMFLKR